jgi:hypothetical protein
MQDVEAENSTDRHTYPEGNYLGQPPKKYQSLSKFLLTALNCISIVGHDWKRYHQKLIDDQGNSPGLLCHSYRASKKDHLFFVFLGECDADILRLGQSS